MVHSRLPESSDAYAGCVLFRKYTNGGIASFTHALTLQGTKYETTLEVFCE